MATLLLSVLVTLRLAVAMRIGDHTQSNVSSEVRNGSPDDPWYVPGNPDFEREIKNYFRQMDPNNYEYFPCCEKRGECMTNDTYSKDGCPLGYHSEGCYCWWKRTRYRCLPKEEGDPWRVCCCSNIAKVAMTKKDAYADKQCPKASTKYYGQEYERAKECRFGRDTRKVFNSKKMDMGDYLFARQKGLRFVRTDLFKRSIVHCYGLDGHGTAEAAKSAISTVIEDYRPRYAQYDRMVMHTGTGQVGMQKIGFFYNRKGLRDEYG